ncbi:hypothetical protein V7S43_016143 [Phytophthora oleae]|uniref:Uncharacterized protein n=1 Tax=Phytophthora oleae TaxID=2107226 RepID=A0ABD3F0U0_9STRA
MSDRAYFDASSSLLLVDTRASQSLEPIRLPAKLRDRIERAQRRANAAKDGVSIFTKESKDARRSATAPETTSTAALGDFEPHRSSTANEEKMHLPDVVLRHKMRDFEARANTGGVALFSVEPADRSLQRLSLEDRERVMLAMQSKIRQIASDVDANFARLTKALDANGIFDSAANIQRAQTLCLVDLQRRCKLEKLRDEAMREVLHLPTSTTAKNALFPRQKPIAKPSDKLSQLLRPSSRARSAETPPPTTTKRRKRKPLHASKLPTLRTADTKGNQKLPSPVSRPATDEPRRGGKATSVPTSLSAAREEVTSAANVGSNDGDLHSRHPHVAQVLQLLTTGEASTNKASASFNTNSAEADMEHARTLDPAEEWTQRNPSYQAVGARAAEAVRRCGERQRWDSLGHFGSKSSIRSLPTALRQRLESQQAAWKRGEDTPRSDNGSDVGDVSEGSNQQHDREMYAELQARIRERLITTERRTRTAAAAIRVRRPLGRTRASPLPQTAPAKMTTSSSAVFLPVGQTLELLGASASEPVLRSGEAESPASLRPSRLGSRMRMSVLEHKVLADPLSRHGRRKESRIGARAAYTDSRAIGRHSEARIAYRRDTAQTWTWHFPPGSSSGDGVGTIAEEEEDYNEDTDLFEEGQVGEENDSEEDEADDATDDGEDDVESVDSSRTSFSSMSLSSVKRRTSNGSRKHGKGKRPPVVQRRASRGRSAGNTLTGHALSLHARLEVIWRVLQFPFSNKLSMLERLSTLQDPDAFISALEHWERITPLVAIRQRMKMALSGYTERGELRPTEWLTASEFALVAALPQPASVSEPSSDLMPPLKTSNREFESMSPSAFVEWVRNHIDVVTLQAQKLAHELKDHTGEELQFQGHPYPSRR